MADPTFVITQGDVAASVRKLRGLHDELGDLAKETLNCAEQEIFNHGNVIELRLSINRMARSPCTEKRTRAIFEAQLKIMVMAEALKLMKLIPENRHLVKGLSSMARQWTGLDDSLTPEKISINEEVRGTSTMTSTTSGVDEQDDGKEACAHTVTTSVNRPASGSGEYRRNLRQLGLWGRSFSDSVSFAADALLEHS